ncbi:cytochrome P450 714C2 [Artemisia annua]|uniref:Cytochrome P450 714C2 n=1 Tax=Artemisia annua TaxID=35608 RepID=A0A2U1P3M8_ARTAN|nr:cytochrome P450 714C2 [Artemisia annua]
MPNNTVKGDQLTMLILAGKTFAYSAGNIRFLCITDPELVKEVSLHTSLDLGKPSYLSKDRGPLFGQGILSSNGPYWSHQRKIIAPHLYPDKVKDMVTLMANATSTVLHSWESKIKQSGDFADIRIDNDLRSVSADIISRACFGSNYSQGEMIFSKLRALQGVMSKASIGVPVLRYVPSKNNRETWKLENDINSRIIQVVKSSDEGTGGKDLLQTIIEAAKKDGGEANKWIHIDSHKFVVDNCKSLYFAGYETTATSASWCLMLLAKYPEWQSRCRAEVLDICRDKLPDMTMLQSMKMLTMVIQEALRLYPPVAFTVRETLKDIKFKNILIPKGINVQIVIPMLHQQAELWGSDVYEFKPERFAEGTKSACKIPQAYMPFGMGPRICAGQHFAITELKTSKCSWHLLLSVLNSSKPESRIIVTDHKKNLQCNQHSSNEKRPKFLFLVIDYTTGKLTLIFQEALLILTHGYTGKKHTRTLIFQATRLSIVNISSFHNWSSL